MRATGPLFQFDPGWLFVCAGLSVCAAGVLLPAQADLRALEEQLAQLQAEEALAYQRLAAHADFIDQVDRSEPAMIKRLAATQLNLVPQGDTPLLLASAEGAPVTGWIDSTLKPDMRPSPPELLSTLSRWTNGPSRLWLFGGGMMAVFMGVLVSPGLSRRARREAGVGEVVGIDDWEAARAAEAATIANASPRVVMSTSALDAEEYAAKRIAPSARVSLWLDRDDQAGNDSEHDISNATAGVLDSHTPEAVDVAEDHFSEIADTVDLEPGEWSQRASKRTVIDDAGFDHASARNARDAAAGELTLTAREIACNEANTLDDDIADVDSVQPNGASCMLIDSREGLGASITHEGVAGIAPQSDGNDVGTGLLDAVKHAHAGRDDAAIDCEADEYGYVDEDVPAAAMIEMKGDGDRRDDETVEARDEPPEQSHSDARTAGASAANDKTTDAVASEDAAQDQDEVAPKSRARGRRRPRRAKRQQTLTDTDGAAEPDSAAEREAESRAGAEACAGGAEAADTELVGAGAASSEATDDSRPTMGEDDDAVSIPFLRNRGRTQDRRGRLADENDEDTDERHALKLRPRPRRRG